MIILERLLFLLLAGAIIYFVVTSSRLDNWINSKLSPKKDDADAIQAEVDRIAAEKLAAQNLIKEKRTSLNKEKRKLNKIDTN